MSNQPIQPNYVEQQLIFQNAQSIPEPAQPTLFQPDHGTSPTATNSDETLILTSSDGSVTITGNSSTNTINLQAASASIQSTVVTTSSVLTGVSQSVEAKSNSAIAVTLPAASALNSGGVIKPMIVTQTGTGPVTVVAHAGDTINGATTAALTFQWSSVTLWPNNAGNGWIIA